jgi:deoxyribonucleoside regulator
MGRPRLDVSPTLAARVATLYYEDNKTHDDIGAMMGLSRWKVARILQHAKDVGIVTIHISQPTSRVTDLEEHIRDHFGIDTVIVVDSNDTPALDAVARQAAEHLIERASGITTLGMSWGRTLTAVANALPHGWARNVDVVQVNGGMSVLDTSQSASWAVAVVADKATGNAHVMPTPAIVQLPETADALRKDPTVSTVLDLAHTADTIMFTVGVASADSAHVRSGYLTPDDISRLRDAGAVGDVVGRFIDQRGHVVDGDLDHRTIGVSLDDVAGVPHRILVAESAAKAPAVISCLRRGLVSSLIVDVALARHIVVPSSLENSHA